MDPGGMWKGGWGALFDICGVGSSVLEAIGGTPRLLKVWGPSVEAGAPGVLGVFNTLQLHCNENPIYAFLFWELRGLSPNFHIMCAWAIYTLPGDTWMWKLGLWPRISQKRNICFKFSVLVLCSVRTSNISTFHIPYSKSCIILGIICIKILNFEFGLTFLYLIS
jgi:hypothetical protein